MSRCQDTTTAGERECGRRWALVVGWEGTRQLSAMSLVSYNMPPHKPAPCSSFRRSQSTWNVANDRPRPHCASISGVIPTVFPKCGTVASMPWPQVVDVRGQCTMTARKNCRRIGRNCPVQQSSPRCLTCLFRLVGIVFTKEEG
jgi:hypothetical protein